MTRKETIRLLAYLGIKAFPVHAAHLGDWCVWSEYSRAIGNRLTNNERHFGKRDLYVSLKDKKILRKIGKTVNFPETGPI